jgi:hypothetical protein
MTALDIGVRTGAMAWSKETLLPDDGLVRLSDACTEELLATAAELDANPLPTEALTTTDFDMPASYAVMRSVRATLNDEKGFSIIDAIPVAQMSARVATQVYWLLMSAVGRPVAQKWDGTMIYDVTDTGRAPAPGNGVRSSKSNRGQGYHTDNAFNTPPEYVSLFCLRPAMEGGLSGLVSMDSVYNKMLARFPEHVDRLFEPFIFDRQREHAPDDAVINTRPKFEVVDEQLKVCLSTDLVRQAHKMSSTPLDTTTHDALAALDAVMEDEDLGKTFEFKAGQIQILNNRRIGHRRTAFTDWPDAEQKRHLVRIWLRQHGKRTYHG